jgi:putative ABC transport system permease protein
MERRKFSLLLMSVFSALALFLGGNGDLRVCGTCVAQRNQEFGIRMALGARPRDVLSAAVWPGISLTLIGIVAGLAGAAGAMRTRSSLLFGISPYYPLTFVAVPAVLGIVAFAACFIPARRAAAVSPLAVLRY